MIKKKLLVMLTACSMALFTAISPVSPLSQISTLTANAAHTHNYRYSGDISVVKNGYVYFYTQWTCHNSGCDDPIITKFKNKYPWNG